MPGILSQGLSNLYHPVFPELHITVEKQCVPLLLSSKVTQEAVRSSEGSAEFKGVTVEGLITHSCKSVAGHSLKLSLS